MPTQFFVCHCEQPFGFELLYCGGIHWKLLMTPSHYYCPGLHSFYATGAREVRKLHGYRLHGPWFIDWWTDDLNEWRERIKCILSFPLIPFPFTSIFLSLSGGGTCIQALIEVAPLQLVVDVRLNTIIMDMSYHPCGRCLKRFIYMHQMQLVTDTDSSHEYSQAAIMLYHRGNQLGAFFVKSTILLVCAARQIIKRNSNLWHTTVASHLRNYRVWLLFYHWKMIYCI